MITIHTAAAEAFAKRWFDRTLHASDERTLALLVEAEIQRAYERGHAAGIQQCKLRFAEVVE